MSRDWSYGEVLKAIFPLLGDTDLTACMSVSRQWRDIAGDDYLWKCICCKRWPSICRNPPSTRFKLLQALSNFCRNHPLQAPKLSFKDLEFYFDIWSEVKLICSESISGPTLRSGIRNLPPGVSDALKSDIENPDCKMMMQVEPRFTIFFGLSFAVSVLVCRKDTDPIACILHESKFSYEDRTAFRAWAFASGIRCWVSLLILGPVWQVERELKNWKQRIS